MRTRSPFVALCVAAAALTACSVNADTPTPDDDPPIEGAGTPCGDGHAAVTDGCHHSFAGGVQVYFKAASTGFVDEFGVGFALSADGSTLAVGAPLEDSAATGIGGNPADNSVSIAGAVYVFARSGTTWSQQAYIKASNTGANDQFGFSIALSADGSTLAVGAIGESSAASGVGGNQADNSLVGAGAVYVFTRSGTTWSQQAYVKASNPGATDDFGFSVALSGDGSTLAVGAYQEGSAATGIDGNQASNAASLSGAVYVFTRSGTAWSQQAYVKASNTGASDELGWSIALSADGATLAAGARFEASAATGVGGSQASNTAKNAGAVYVFTRSGTTWSQQAYVKASNTNANDQFGTSVALSADGATLAVGAFAEASAATGIGGNQADNAAASAGAVYVFARSGATWSQQAYVKASNTNANDQFGFSVALSADGAILAAGAPVEDSAAIGIGGNQADNSALNAGAAYVFTRSGTTWSQQAYVKASNTNQSDQFGYSVALAADGTLAVGAPGEASAATGVNGNQADNSLVFAGAVYVVP
jgi:FG-GAP repeat